MEIATLDEILMMAGAAGIERLTMPELVPGLACSPKWPGSAGRGYGLFFPLHKKCIPYALRFAPGAGLYAGLGMDFPGSYRDCPAGRRGCPARGLPSPIHNAAGLVYGVLPVAFPGFF